MRGLSTIGNISLGLAFVAGRNLVTNPATGKTAFLIFFMLNIFYFLCAKTIDIVQNNTLMTYVITENCIKCKYTDCVEVCPVDCFHEGPNFLVINPD